MKTTYNLEELNLGRGSGIVLVREQVQEEHETFLQRGIFSYRYLFLAVVSFLLFLMFLPTINAHFVCGQVGDADDGMSSQWFEVRIFYSGERENYEGCEISPKDNKYCCDVRAIPESSWKIGKEVFAGVIDYELGYVTEPVSVVTTGEGFDVMPEMKLEKVIEINSPVNKLMFSNDSKFILNASFKEPYNFVELEREGVREILCEGCESIEKEIDGNFGVNEFAVIAGDGTIEFIENLSFMILNDYVFERVVGCEGCKDNRVKSNQVVNMSLIVNLSHEVTGLKLKEYVPVDWEVVDIENGEMKSYSETHNMIVWEVNMGKEIVKKYQIRAPDKKKFISRDYIFRVELGNELLKEDLINVKGYFPYFSLKEKIDFKLLSTAVRSRIYPDKPLVLRPKNNIVRIAVFPKAVEKNVEFSLEKGSEEVEDEFEDFEVVYGYEFVTNLDIDDVEKIYVEFKIEKEIIEVYEEIVLLYEFWDNGEKFWKEAEINVYNEDEDYVYYNAEIIGSEVAIIGLKQEKWYEGLIFWK